MLHILAETTELIQPVAQPKLPTRHLMNPCASNVKQKKKEKKKKKKKRRRRRKKQTNKTQNKNENKNHRKISRLAAESQQKFLCGFGPN